MKVVPINRAGSNSFKGLWEKPVENVTGLELHCINKRIDNTYHPFADEDADKVKRELALKKYDVIVPTPNEYEHEHFVSEPIEGKRLSFTKNEFLSYRKYYGAKLPETLKKVEKELAENGLSAYINGGFLYSAKKFLHRIKLI